MPVANTELKNIDWDAEWLVVYYDDLLPRELTVTKYRIGDYQGDILYLLEEPSTQQFGILIQSYGSCSGCDELEAIGAAGYRAPRSEVKEELSKLAVRMFERTFWGTRDQILNYLKDRDGANSWFMNNPEGQMAIQEIIFKLEAAPTTNDAHGFIATDNY